MRWAMTRVLPLPAPASTSTGPFVVVTASRCGGLSGASRLSAVTAGCGIEANVTTTARGRGPHPALSPGGEGESYSTVTDLARVRGWSTARPRRTGLWEAQSRIGIHRRDRGRPG